ncbi:septum formation family protein [Mycetocola reblochoni]|uniref:Septum formation-related domain-containing protein n=2 Tax=Mycetocola reblochoni TaxID=331618 RepID=A0A1R4ITY2_9MICO|nr:septum formation family protein [Mycetocola reblochoni]RLP71061.1 hypothetical protein D9V30_01155 [Mycetocola reblochoni]SJN23035.1 hypothetical protein FM119_03445 [Mycetocola reblochoni REB411]
MNTPRLTLTAVTAAAIIALTSGCSALSGLLPSAEPVRDDSGQISEAADNADVFALTVGDCFTEIDASEVTSVPVVPCSEPHDYEAYAATELPDGDFPGEDELIATADDFCHDEFETFVGTLYGDSEFDYSYLYPQEAGWDGGDHEILCLVYGQDQLTGSVEGARS